MNHNHTYGRKVKFRCPFFSVYNPDWSSWQMMMMKKKTKKKQNFKREICYIISANDEKNEHTVWKLFTWKFFFLSLSLSLSLVWLVGWKCILGWWLLAHKNTQFCFEFEGYSFFFFLAQNSGDFKPILHNPLSLSLSHDLLELQSINLLFHSVLFCIC